MDLRTLYDGIMNLQEMLRVELHLAPEMINQPIDYRTVKALSATYELQEYLANRIAAAVADGILDPDPE